MPHMKPSRGQRVKTNKKSKPAKPKKKPVKKGY